MKKVRGFFLKHKVITLFRCIRRRPHPSPTKYHRRLNPSPRSLSKILKWVARVKTKAFGSSGYFRVGKDPDEEETGHATVPKGKMAVYVGQNDGVCERVLVPVIYINHPLFGQLLSKAEEEYGHDHPGGITIPCRISEFENVKTRIAAGYGGRKMMPWRLHV